MRILRNTLTALACVAVGFVLFMAWHVVMGVYFDMTYVQSRDALNEILPFALVAVMVIMVLLD